MGQCSGTPLRDFESPDPALNDLLYAAAGGRVGDVERLLRNGVSVNAVNYDRRSALHVSASEGRAAVVVSLLAAKADVNPKDRWSHTPLDDANRTNVPDVCKVLLDAGGVPAAHLGGGDEADGSPTSVDIGTALCCAAAAGSLLLIQDLHKKGASMNSADYDKRTALTIAALHGHANMVRWLVEQGADVNHVDNFGYTASVEAARHGHRDVVKILIEAGAEAGDIADMKQQAVGESWAIPLSEITINKEIGKTLKSAIYLATWRGTTVVCKSAGELHTNSSGRRLERQLTSLKPAKGGPAKELDETQKELVREIGLLSKLRHPDLVMFLGACVEHIPPLVLTEFMEGGDLERHYRSQAEKLGHPFRPSTAKLLSWSSSVARALAFLHEASRPIIHRDLKPLNLLLNRAEELKVTDFGISKLMAAKPSASNGNGEEQDDSMQPTMSGGVGTWRYMAPEVVRYEQYTDRVDIYSYALILWFMNTGRQPFVEMFGPDPEAVLKEYSKGKEPRPDAAAMRCPAAFRTLVQDAWHVQAGSRPSAVECTQRLAAIIASQQDSGLVDSLKKHLHLQ